MARHDLPPYFVAGAIFSGMSMVLTLMIVARAVMPPLHDYLTLNHIEAMTKLVLVTSCMVALAYASEFFIAMYSGNPYERYAFLNRALGPYAWAFWTMVSCNVIVPQLYWFRRVRRSIAAVFAISILVNVGMWAVTVIGRTKPSPRIETTEPGWAIAGWIQSMLGGGGGSTTWRIGPKN